ncbi:phosphatidylinositol-specific phospholipase C domain-containing protein [Bacillus cereus]|nr:phosphatidylinositol-specific phospholipase C domain-containing protein [Bacillus cereus]
MNQYVTTVQKAVNALFSNNTLPLNITDYNIDQTAYLVERISNDRYSKDKMMLLNQVKFAKRLSRARNLLKGGAFELSDKNRWKTNNYANILSGSLLSKGQSLNILSASPTVSSQIIPTHVYQRIDESKLKPYTRYLVRGFVEKSRDLELFVLRYNKEVYKRINVPKNEDYHITSHLNEEENPWHNKYIQNTPVQNSISMRKNSHEFTCHIDIGELDIKKGPGITIGFQISTTDGMATLDNIEVIEAHPLTGDDLTRIQRRERKWKQKWLENQIQIEKAAQTAKEAIKNLFTCPQQNQLTWMTTLNDIIQAEKLIQEIPYWYSRLLGEDFPILPEEAYDTLQQLSTAVETAKLLYAQRNVVNNGDFQAGFSNWNTTDGAEIKQIQDSSSVLVITDWAANISQDMRVVEKGGYLLRVTAKKEDAGEGYITISDCSVVMEKLTFTTGDSVESLAHSDIYSRIHKRYAKKQITNHLSERYEIESNPHLINRAEQNASLPSSYVTKTIEVFPETNRVRVEIGETGGTFIVESVELIRMEQMNETNNPAVDIQTVMNDTPATQFDPVSFTESTVSPRNTQYAYSHDSNIGYENPNWMADISGDTLFSDLSIPGTHNTMAFYGGDITQCQTMSLNTQLHVGIRYLDIRCRHIENIFAIHHGIVYQNATFTDVCIAVRDFLRNNPSETVFMRIKEEHTAENNTRSFGETFADYKSQYSDLFWNWTGDNPRLSEIRGKVVVLQNFFGDKFGIDYNTLNKQDQYHLNTNWDLYDKWLFVKEHLYAADDSYKNGRKQAYLNYLSGSGGSFPYFVASGHSSPGTNASNLSTGLTTPAFESWYPDFPRGSCFIGICTIYFEGTNILTSEWIQKSDFKYVGIIAADFPGRTLISNIISLNNLLSLEIKNGGTYQIVSALNNSSVVDMNPGDQNIHLWNNNGTANQLWKFVYNSNELAYQIKSLSNENLVLTWAYNSSNPDNVIAASNQNRSEQYWIPERTGAYHYFKNLSNRSGALDVSGSETKNGTNILYWSYKKATNQKFKLTEVNVSGGQAEGVYLYADANYVGQSVGLTNSVADLSEVGMNDIASSIKFIGPYQATLYEHADFKGAVFTPTTNIANLKDVGMNDTISSIKITKTSGGRAAGIYLYSDANYVGRSIWLTSNVANLKDVGMNDTISSVEIVGAYGVTLYGDANYTGKAYALTSNVANLKDVGMNDIVSSIKIFSV